MGVHGVSFVDLNLDKKPEEKKKQIFIFSSIEDFKTWLADALENDITDPYHIKLNIDSLGGHYNQQGSVGKLLKDNSEKYFIIDLLDSIITNVENVSFYGLNNLVHMILPNSTTVIGDQAFTSCKNLATINIPASVTTIKDRVFHNCTNLTNITVDSNNNNFCSEDGVLYNKEKSVLIFCPPNKPGNTFTVPDTVIRLENYSIFANRNIENLHLPNSIKGFGDQALSETNLINIVIPSGVTKIGANLFYVCRKLTSVTIPSSVTSIESQAFYNCSNLIEIVCERTTPPSMPGNNTIRNAHANLQIKVPAASVDAYKATNGWKAYAANIVAIE